MEKGNVVWFDVKKGFGFIRRNNGSDVFVHYSKIIAPDGVFKVLYENDIVEFDIFFADRNGQNRPQAKDVRLLREADNAALYEERNDSFGRHGYGTSRDQIQEC